MEHNVPGRTFGSPSSSQKRKTSRFTPSPKPNGEISSAQVPLLYTAGGRKSGRTTQRRRVTTRRGRAREYNGAQPMERGLQFVTTRPSGRLHPSTLVVVVVVPFQLFPHLKRLRLFPSDSCPVQRRSASQPVSLLP